jgi:hypothetical protein
LTTDVLARLEGPASGTPVAALSLPSASNRTEPAQPAVIVRFICSAPELFSVTPPKRAPPISSHQQMEIVQRIGPNLTPIASDGWMTFTPHPELPGFPTHTFDVMYKEHSYFKAHAS